MTARDAVPGWRFGLPVAAPGGASRTPLDVPPIRT